MADPQLIPGNTIAWRKIREQIAKCVTVSTPPFTRVHRLWKLRFDLQKSQSQVTVLPDDAMTAEQRLRVGKIHGYMIGIRSATVDRGENNLPPVIGGSEFEYWLNIDVWGFLDYTLGSKEANSQDMIEDEFAAIARTIFKNKKLALDPADQPFLKAVEPFELTSLDVVNFSEGHDAHFAQGALRVRIVENF